MQNPSEIINEAIALAGIKKKKWKDRARSILKQDFKGNKRGIGCLVLIFFLTLPLWSSFLEEKFYYLTIVCAFAVLLYFIRHFLLCAMTKSDIEKYKCPHCGQKLGFLDFYIDDEIDDPITETARLKGCCSFETKIQTDTVMYEHIYKVLRCFSCKNGIRQPAETQRLVLKTTYDYVCDYCGAHRTIHKVDEGRDMRGTHVKRDKETGNYRSSGNYSWHDEWYHVKRYQDYEDWWKYRCSECGHAEKEVIYSGSDLIDEYDEGYHTVRD